MHADASPNEEATLSWVQSPKSKVSYHVLIARDGTTYRIVPDNRIAWACGVSAWNGVSDVNSVSLNVAFANRQDGREPLTTAQRVAAQAVITEWLHRWPAIEAVTTHAIVARPKGRKHDPETAPNFHLTEYQP